MTTIWKEQWYKSSQHLGFILIGVALFIYLALRITTVCFSDDEYMTYTLFVQQPWLDILVSNCNLPDWEPNNHVLNTLCMKTEMLLFGKKDWAMRLHILLAWLVFYKYTCKLVQLFTSSIIRQGCYLLIIICHQYILDFFGLARGYAISMAAIIAMIYYYAFYLRQPSNTNIYKICVALFIAIWANFSAMYFAFFIIPSLAFISYIKCSKAVFLKHFYFLYLFVITIIIVCGIPIYKTLQSEELYGGNTGIFQDCVVSFVNQAINHNWYINRHYVFANQWKLIEVIATGFLLFWIVIQIVSIKLKPKYKHSVFQQHLLFFLVLCAIFFKILFVIQHTPIPINRTLLLFSIPFFCSVCLALESIILQQFKWKVLLYACSICLLIHFYFCINLVNTVEWWQNGDAKKITICIKNNMQIQKNPHATTIGAENWQYHSLAFYVETQLKPPTQIIWTDLSKNNNYDYLVVPNHKQNLVGAQYKLLQQLGKTSVYLLNK